MKKLLFSICFMAGACAVHAQTTDPAGPTPNTAQENPNAPKFSFKNGNTHDFGTIKESAEGADYTFEFTNTGKEPLIIQAATPSCSCTAPSFSKEPVLPGKKGIVKVHYNSQGHPGPFVKSVWLSSNASGNARYELVIKGTVTAATPAAANEPVKQ